MSSLDPQVVALLERLAAAGAPPVGSIPAAELRANYAAGAAATFGPVDEVASVEDTTTGGGVAVRIYRPEAATGAGLVYFHGGGWVVGSVETHDGITRALARHSGRTVVSVDYRLAPEHPFPAPLDDAWSATEWALAELGFDRVAVGGDSSGGTLAAVVARRARGAIDAQLLINPVTDHRFDTGSYEEFADGYFLTRAAMRWYWAQYLGGADGSDPDASPLRAGDLSGLARAIVVVAECDPLRDEVLAYAEKLAAAGVEVEELRYPGMIHNFVRLAASLDRSHEALAEIGALLG